MRSDFYTLDQHQTAVCRIVWLVKAGDLFISKYDRENYMTVREYGENSRTKLIDRLKKMLDGAVVLGDDKDLWRIQTTWGESLRYMEKEQAEASMDDFKTAILDILKEQGEDVDHDNCGHHPCESCIEEGVSG